MNEVYAIDMLISTGDGKSRDMDFRTTIYKREPDQVYQLKMKASRGDYSSSIWLSRTNLVSNCSLESQLQIGSICSIRIMALKPSF